MALINCNECGREVSDKAQSCPSCGAPIANKIILEADLPKIAKNNPKDYSFRIFLLVLFSLLTTVIFTYRREISNAIFGDEARLVKSTGTSRGYIKPQVND